MRSDLSQSLKKLRGDLATARIDHAKALHEAKEKAKAAAKAEELAENEAAVSASRLNGHGLVLPKIDVRAVRNPNVLSIRL